MHVSAGACGNETAVLGEARGEFGSNYGKDESCQWRIQVDEDQVNIAGFKGQYCATIMMLSYNMN